MYFNVNVIHTNMTSKSRQAPIAHHYAVCWVNKDEFENDEKIRRFLWSSNVRSTFKNVEFESNELTFSGTTTCDRQSSIGLWLAQRPLPWTKTNFQNNILSKIWLQPVRI